MKHYLNYERSPRVNLSVQYYLNNVFRKIEFLFLVLLCLVFIIFVSNHKDFSNKISSFFIDISLPVIKVAQIPFTIVSDTGSSINELVTAKRENKILRSENEKLKSLYIKALNIRQENEELRDLLHFIKTRSVKYQSVQLITKPNQPYSSNIIIDAGTNKGITENSIITGKRAVIGRVINVMENKSRVLTISDENSRIPILTAKSRARGILTGHNNNIMTIEYLDKDHHIQKGEMVFTSGDDDHLPPGLLIGIVSKVDGSNVQVRAVENADHANLAVITQY